MRKRFHTLQAELNPMQLPIQNSGQYDIAQVEAPVHHAEPDVISIPGLVDTKHFDNASDTTKRQIKHEQTYGLFEILKFAAYYTLIFSSVTTYVLWKSVDHTNLLVWFGVLNACAIGRHVLCHAFLRAKPAGKDLDIWLRRVWVACALVGLAWCGLVWMTWGSQQIVVITFIAVTMAFLALGTYAAMSFYPEAYLGAALPQCLSIGFVYWHIASVPELVGLLAIVGLVVLSMIQSSFTSRRIWRSTMVFLHEHQSLARDFREKSAVLSTTLHSIGDGVVTVDPSGRVTYINPAAERLTGLSLKDIVGKSVTDTLHLSDEAADGRPVNLGAIFKDLREAMVIPGELVLNSVCVTAVSVDVTISPLLYFSDNEVDGYVVTLHDVTLSRRKARDLSRQALQDPLTGLLNRRGFETRLHDALEQRLHDSVSHCLCYIDLDRFKAVNDTCGHQAGDELLKEMVTLMQSRIRDSDAFARLGGDEFAVLLRGCSLKKASRVAEEICSSVAAYRFKWDDKEFSIGTSIGVVPMIDSDSLKSITEAADNACYRAKEGGRGRVCVDARGTDPNAERAVVLLGT